MDDFRERVQAELSDAFAIERELGGGGMSRVFLAEERALGRRVVIKVLAPELVAGVSADRFAREIRLTAKLQHPQIVPVHAAGVTVGLPYYVMPYVEGESLRDQLARTGPLPIATTVHILRDVAKALAFAHERGVVHRDIKPGNILLSGESATVADFGIGKAFSASAAAADGVHSLTGLGTAVGTPAYIAPEQAAGDVTSDHRADLFSFGVVAYEMLTGASPFAGRTPRETIAAVMSMTPASVRDSRPEVPVALANLVARCLEKDPAQRPQSAVELIAALDGATTPGGFTATFGQPRRRLLIATGLAAAALLAVTLAVRGAGGRASASGERAIAVLPCTNVDRDTAAEYFVDGITGELIGRLAREPGLRVTPRASVFSTRGKGLDLAAIGRQLKVSTVVECTIRRLGPNVRVTADLVDLDGERTLWAGTFDGALQGIVAVQDTLARAVTSALHLAGTRPREAARTTTDTATYLLTLRGRYLWNQRTTSSMRRGIASLEAAIARDSAFAPAWAELAMAYALFPAFGDVPTANAVSPARAAAQRAIRLDSTVASAHIALGIIGTFFDLDFDAALRQLDRAVALDPTDATAPLFRTWALIGLGRTDEALASIRTARQLDPFAPIINTRVGTVLVYAGLLPEALLESRRAVELDSANVLARYQVAEILAYLGRYDEARAAAPPIENVTGGMDEARLAWGIAQSGRRELAEATQRRLDARARAGHVTPEAFAMLALAAGDRTKALEWMERAAKERSFYVVFFAVEPAYRGLRDDPRYKGLLQRLGIRAPAR